MKFTRPICLFLITACLFSACAPLPINRPTLAPALPDLVVSSMYVGMHGVPTHGTGCVPSYGPLEIRTEIQNLGQASANNFEVVEVSSGTILSIGELVASQGIELVFPITSANGTYKVEVDPQDAITESEEGNNTFSYFAITPTPPALCTPTSTPSANLSTPVSVGGSESKILTWSLLSNGKYHSPDWGEFQLTGGIYYRTPPTPLETAESYTTRIQPTVLYGDINEDGVEDALVFLSTQSGGSGNFIELAAVLNQNGSANNVSTIYMGDRVVVESGKVENGIIVLNMRVQGPNDGMCCPSQFATWRFVLNGDQLTKMP